MPRNSSKNLGPTTIALVVASLACLGLAACGSSSGGGSSSSASTPTAAKTTAEATPTTPTTTTSESTTTTPESTTPTTTTSTTPELSLARRTQIAASVSKCLRGNGANVAEPNAAGNLKIEKSVSSTPQYQAALKKCHAVIAKAFAEEEGK
jgi:hypothetical protein